MSRLPKAPLLEVLFELRWDASSDKEKKDYQYLHGDLFNTLKEKYPFRELIIPGQIPIEAYFNQVAHRFRASSNSYPLVQVGPGIFTVNTVEANYIWQDYQSWVIDAVDKLISLESYNKELPISLALKYFDFIPFDFSKNDIKDFLKDNLHINIKQDFYKNKYPPYSINLGFIYGTEEGVLNIAINRGGINNKEPKEGIIIQIEVTQQGVQAKIPEVSRWLNAAHLLTSETFSEMTKGKLQESFK